MTLVLTFQALIAKGFEVVNLPTEPNLINLWGFANNGKGSNFIVAANGSSSAVLFRRKQITFKLDKSSPTGIVFNNSKNFQGARWIAATEEGEIFAIPQPSESKKGFVIFTAENNAIYKGLAIVNHGRNSKLFATDFHNNKIDILAEKVIPGGKQLQVVKSIANPIGIPKHFAPFGIAHIENKLYVTYAKQDKARLDEVAGAGKGFVAVFDLKGNFLRILIEGGVLNAPWGIDLAPVKYGKIAKNNLIVGNFGDGKINVFDQSGNFLFTLNDSQGSPIVIDGLWATVFNLSKNANPTLYFTAGPADETLGLLGIIIPSK